jgi:cytochrome bd-type quinol oxidase subunit 2
MFYLRYLVPLHVLGVLGLLASHGVSMFAMYRIRRVGSNREKIAELIAFSGSTVIPMYVSLAVLLVTGVAVALKFKYLSEPWILWSIVVLVAVLVSMYALARPYFRRLTASCAMRPSGVPRVSDEELQELVTSPRAHLLTVIGAVGLAIIVFLMVNKPGLGT